MLVMQLPPWKRWTTIGGCAVAQQLLGEARASGRVCAHDLKYEESFTKRPHADGGGENYFKTLRFAAAPSVEPTTT